MLKMWKFQPRRPEESTFRSRCRQGLWALTIGVMMLSACAPTTDAPPESPKVNGPNADASKADQGFEDDFESGDTSQWKDDPADKASAGDVAVEDGFESGDTGRWEQDESGSNDS